MKNAESLEDIVRAYLYRNVREFLDAKEEIRRGLNLSFNRDLERILIYSINSSSIYFVDYLEGRSEMDELKQWIKREIRILLSDTRVKLGVFEFLPTGQMEVESLFLYIVQPVFLTFKDRTELTKIIERAKQLAEKLGINAKDVFTNEENSNEFLRMFYKREELEEKLKNLLEVFSLEKVIKRTMGSSDEENRKKVEGLLKQCRDNIEIQGRFRKLQDIFRTIIQNKIDEVYSARK